MPAMPVYRRVIEDIKSKIVSGQWPPGYVLPPPRALAEAYRVEWDVGVSGPSVRKATDILQETGWLIGRQGVAVSVAPNPPIARG